MKVYISVNSKVLRRDLTAWLRGEGHEVIEDEAIEDADVVFLANPPLEDVEKLREKTNARIVVWSTGTPSASADLGFLVAGANKVLPGNISWNRLVKEIIP